MDTFYHRHQNFLIDYKYYIQSAIHDIQDHIYTFQGSEITVSELREALNSEYHWCDEILLEALIRHGWTTATFLKLLDMSDSQWPAFQSLKVDDLSDRYSQFRRDFERLDNVSRELSEYRGVLTFAMAKAFYKMKLDRIDDTQVKESLPLHNMITVG
jgi:methionine synthase II (cobalamin-independent)